MKPRSSLALVAALSVLAMPVASAGQFLIDLSDNGGSAAGWDVFTTSVTDASVTDQNSVDNDVTLSIGTIGGEGLVAGIAGGTLIDGTSVPSEAWDDYFYGPAPYTGTEILFEFKNLDAGTYDVSVFLGRNNTQFGRIWAGTVGDDPGSQNTGDFGFGSSTVTVTVGAGDSLFYVHQEDGTGGTSGLIVQTAVANPVISTLSPANDAVDVPVSTNLVATFDRDIAAGTGNITIKNLTETTQTSFPVGDGQVSISGAVLTIDPTTDLDAGDEYAIQFANGAIEDTSGNPFAGITDDTTWSFFTDGTAPTVDTLIPANNAIGVLGNADLSITFDEDVMKGTGNIVIKESGGTPVHTIAVADTTVSGATVTIDPPSDLAGDTSYYVEVAAGAITDLSGNPYAGINDDTTWSFTTALDAGALFLIDLSDNGGSAASWDVVTTNVTDAAVTDQSGIDNDVTLTIAGIGGEGGAGGGATTIDGVSVPAEANGDYVWGTGGNTDILFEFKNLDAGTYNVSVFLGAGGAQFGKIWAGVVGDEPGVQNTGSFGGSSSTRNVTIGAGDSLFYLHQEDNAGGTSGIMVRAASPPPEETEIRIDLSDNSGSAANWDIFTSDVTDSPVTDRSSGTNDDDVTLSITGILGEGNAGAPGTGATIDTVTVPKEARDDYVYGAGGAGSILFEFKNVDAGTYNVSVFEGNTGDANQEGTIWVGVVGDEPAKNTGNYAGGDSTVEVTVGAGDSLFFRHFPGADYSGGTSGLIIRGTGGGGGGNDFSDWIASPGFGIPPGEQGFEDDPDGDKLGNGIEAFFGTDPSVFSTGLTQVSVSGAVLSFEHPEADPPLDDVTGSYEWSLDLENWHPSGTVGDTTVTITPTGPASGTTTVTADTTGSIVTPTQLFIRAVATQ